MASLSRTAAPNNRATSDPRACVRAPRRADLRRRPAEAEAPAAPDQLKSRESLGFRVVDDAMRVERAFRVPEEPNHGVEQRDQTDDSARDLAGVAHVLEQPPQHGVQRGVALRHLARQRQRGLRARGAESKTLRTQSATTSSGTSENAV